MRISILTLILAFSALGLRSGVAADKIGVSLYLAQNAAPESNAVLAPEKLRPRLHEVFGFKHYILVKAGEIELGKKWEQWVIPRKDFFIRVEPLPRKSDEPQVIDYEIYKDGFIVAKGKYEPHPDTPLFINGPDFKKGQFIFVLEAR